MRYAIEDEVDWSDGSLDPRSPEIKPIVDQVQVSPIAVVDNGGSSIFIADSHEWYSVPCGVPLASASLLHNDAPQPLTRAQRARLGIRSNRRAPSKEDYSNVVLYQANQKAYEATFFKRFIAHSLDPKQIAKCFENDTEMPLKVQQYLKSVVGESDRIANKMVWNAHCRSVNLLANDGKDGAPFLDVHTLKTEVVSKFGPGTTFLVAKEMTESWHRADSNVPIVRYTTKDYPVGHHVGPLEEVDEIANTLFRPDAFTESLPTGRVTKPPTSKKRRGQNMPGAAEREDRDFAHRRNWLNFSSYNIGAQRQSPPSQVRAPSATMEGSYELDGGEQSALPASIDGTQSGDLFAEVPTNPLESCPATSVTGQTQLEQLFNRYGNDALSSEYTVEPPQDHILDSSENVPSWRMRLVEDHKQRLMQKWGNPSRPVSRARLSLKQAVTAAMRMGFRPTAADYRTKIRVIAAQRRKQYQRASQSQKSFPFASLAGANTEHTTTQDSRGSPVKVLHAASRGVGNFNYGPHQPTISQPSGHSVSSCYKTDGKSRTGNQVKRGLAQIEHPPIPRKKRCKIVASATRTSNNKPITHRRSDSTVVSKTIPHSNFAPIPPHPSGSTTLEPHQHLPPGTYFDPQSIDDIFAWRCGVKHAMGYYYNGGDRKSCRGCNTTLSGNQKLVRMDFYMPSRSFYHQPAPGVKWRPSKPSRNARKSSRPCHNSVAKDAYWMAIQSGATEDQARQVGVNAVVEYLRPKPPPKEPTPEPTPEPEPDLGPHESGSTTMEHGQELPECAYWTKRDRHEEFAWRCDVNHALGRYYLAGDKRCCPGCGTNKGGLGKQMVMDFYMDAGAVIRQEAPDIVKWKPRKYKARAASSTTSTTKPKNYTHNQICAEKYFDAIAKGKTEQEALILAIEATDAYLDERAEEGMSKLEDQDNADEAKALDEIITETVRAMNDDRDAGQLGSTPHTPYRRNSRGGCTVSLVPSKRRLEEEYESEPDDGGRDPNDEEEGQGSPTLGKGIERFSSEEETSGSDSE